jgi:hypothetical protein
MIACIQRISADNCIASAVAEALRHVNASSAGTSQIRLVRAAMSPKL